MVFSSVPPYLDPSNWQQQPPPPPINHHHQPDHHPHPPPPPPTHGGGSIRPGSMADRARLANIPMPEGPLKCPRCDSTNTKFCYFNNYNLSQPRHFCKTCRRYWTRGGALRNVPVGGGCRRNKRTKGSSSSKPPSSSSATTTAAGGVTSGGMEILGLPNLRAAAAMAPPLQSYLTDFGYGGGGEPPLGMNYGGGGGGAMERLRFTQMTSQFPFMAGSDPYGPFEGTIEPSGFMGLLPPSSRPKTPSSAAEVAAAAVKMENNSSNNNNNNNNNQDLNLSRQFLGMMNSTSSNDQVAWNGTSGAWKMDLSSFGSSTGNNNPP